MSGQTNFSSDLLLTREQIKEMGIPDHQAELFARFMYTQKFAIDAWTDSPLVGFTFPSVSFKLTFEQAEALLSFCKSRRLNRELSDAEKAHVESIREKINSIVQDRFGGNRWFVKLSTRSPKDAFLFDTDNLLMHQLLEAEIARLPDRSLQSLNVAYVKASNRAMGCQTADDAFEMFRRSDRIVQDISKQIEFGPKFCDVSIVMREWIDEIVDRPEYEFRCFCHQRRLNAITQYFCWMHFPELCARKDELQQLMVNFFNIHVAQAAPFESFVIDFYITKANEVKIIEFNPFGNSAGSGLFSWTKDREVFLNGPLEFRVRLPDADSKASIRTHEDQIPKGWMRWIKAHVKAKYGEVGTFEDEEQEARAKEEADTEESSSGRSCTIA